MEENATNIIVMDSAGRAVLGAVFARSGPKIGLPAVDVSEQMSMLYCGQGTYVVYQRIGCDIVIAGQFGQGQALATFDDGRTFSRSLWRHGRCNIKPKTARDQSGKAKGVSWNAKLVRRWLGQRKPGVARGGFGKK